MILSTDSAQERTTLKKQQKRKMLVQELIHTEETYVAALDMLVNVFVEPLAYCDKTSNNCQSNMKNSSIISSGHSLRNNNSNKKKGSDRALHVSSILQRKYGARGIFQGMNAQEIYGLNQSLLCDLKEITAPLLTADINISTAIEV